MMATVHLCSYHCLINYDSESVCVFFQGMSAGRRRDIVQFTEDLKRL